ncbi:MULTISPECIES: FadR/GntR family transcriptional regulator [unclassified Streptomyces]|uniref:FadR/GntR family transcriptional regulator n=1 Tax=unclassified Streptomyces TaxID=2593676 RepID=UPI000DB963C3|nr:MULTISPECIES: FadR/GntR family transcriptional regulator [unclassified Streptomyces]MYT74420.1 FCD domain-containing protein [Streptomyces sp. SID8367]RAJ91398.1 DNA-binding FadR family transcriptional regulator [Streptomyces sp. PsTaAH-137]
MSEAAQPTLVQRTIGRIERSIESGEWAVGDRIPAEGQLVEALGVGRNTVREAVRALCHTGLLEARRGDGTYVRAASDLNAALQRRLRRAELKHVLQVRLAIEREAAPAAAVHRGEDDLARILSAFLARRRAQESGDAAAYVDADLEFHRAIVAASGNPLMAELYESLVEAVRDSIASLRPSWAPELPGACAHEDLADAIARRDPDAATKAAWAHTQTVEAAMERMGNATPD